LKGLRNEGKKKKINGIKRRGDIRFGDPGKKKRTGTLQKGCLDVGIKEGSIKAPAGESQFLRTENWGKHEQGTMNRGFETACCENKEGIKKTQSKEGGFKLREKKRQSQKKDSRTVPSR